MKMCDICKMTGALLPSLPSVTKAKQCIFLCLYNFFHFTILLWRFFYCEVAETVKSYNNNNIFENLKKNSTDMRVHCIIWAEIGCQLLHCKLSDQETIVETSRHPILVDKRTSVLPVLLQERHLFGWWFL